MQNVRKRYGLTTNRNMSNPRLNSATTIEVTQASTVGNWIVPVLLIGPTLTALGMIANRHALIFAPPGALGYGLLAMVGAVWNPVMTSIPGALAQFGRPRVQTAAAWFGWLAGLAIVATQIH